ncbi:Importin subunit alpha [Carpediemonas membranifera]|uniref:Importin subunit alpha n=1 Tax=Carpediemonas membranifera TaxID=201153 RepID=A0A8J6AW48_9EUKA|nr:Importin subunit alpha [Carpediemonas membranifera]|eukprot:KAG9393965.1 Importin subunit alpha [Carpediemonas membranifera]
MDDRNVRRGFQNNFQRKSIKQSVNDLRKKKREEMLESSRADPSTEPPIKTIDVELPDVINEDVIMSYADKLLLPDPDETLVGLVAVRKLISRRKNATVNVYEVLVRRDVISRVSPFANCDSEKHAHEACWILTNIASRESAVALTVVKAGAVPRLIQTIHKTKNLQLAEQAIWALANIAGEGTQYRSNIIRMGIVESMTSVLGRQMDRKHVRNITWAVSNIARTPLQDPKDIKELTKLVPLCANVFRSVQVDPTKQLVTVELDILVDIIFFFSFVADGDDDDITVIVKENLTPMIVSYMAIPYARLNSACLRCLGNLMSSHDKTIGDYLVSCGVVPGMLRLFQSALPSVRREVAWAMSNIVAGSQDHLKVFVDHNAVPIVLRTMEHDVPEVATECSWIVMNYASACNDEQMQHLLDCGALETLFRVLKSITNYKTKSLILDAVSRLLTKRPDATSIVESVGGVQLLSSLMYNQYASVSNTAQTLLQEHFSDDVGDLGELGGFDF